jgi:integrase/recombinase XerD
MGRQEELSSTFGTTNDPLLEFNDQFLSFDWSALDDFFEEKIEPRDIADSTKYGYRLAIDQLEEWMEENHPDRSPACVNEDIARGFALYLRDERENDPETAGRKLYVLSQAYQYFSKHPNYPHGGKLEDDEDGNTQISLYNPFDIAREKVNFGDKDRKEPPRITKEEVREKLSGCRNIRERLVIVLQFKLGLRASELCNIRLSEFHIRGELVNEHYPEMGSHYHLQGRENAIYIPDNNERPGNKSQRARVLPLDEESREVIREYLKIRPDVDSDRLLLSGNTATPMEKEGVQYIWKKYWRPEYDETEYTAAIGSHFGRHFFGTFWGNQDVPVPLLKYMRGDTLKSDDDYKGAVSEYIHTHYEDIEPVYTEKIYKIVPR